MPSARWRQSRITRSASTSPWARRAFRELTALPSAATDHFDTRLSRVPTDT
jgi:hypothetical protein